MSLLPTDGFRNLENWKREMDRFFQEWPTIFGQGLTGPRIDVHETEREVIATCEVPGVQKKEDIRIEVQDHALVISGNVSRANEIREEQMFRRERFVGRFHRTVNLPAKVLSDGTRASYKNGLLEIRMPKAQEETRRLVDVDFH